MIDFNNCIMEFEVGHYAIAEVGGVLTKYRAYEILERRPEENQLLLRDDSKDSPVEFWVDSRCFRYFPYSAVVFAEGEHKTIDELLHEIAYSWDHTYWPSTLHKDEDGLFHVNKLTISPFWTEYKGQYEKVAPGLYEYLCRIYEVIEEAREKFGKPKMFDGTEVQDE